MGRGGDGLLSPSQRHAASAYIRRMVTVRERVRGLELASRVIGATGLGFRENVVGTGTDNGREALDRRLELKITGVLTP